MPALRGHNQAGSFMWICCETLCNLSLLMREWSVVVDAPFDVFHRSPVTFFATTPRMIGTGSWCSALSKCSSHAHVLLGQPVATLSHHEQSLRAIGSGSSFLVGIERMLALFCSLANQVLKKRPCWFFGALSGLLTIHAAAFLNSASISTAP